MYVESIYTSLLLFLECHRDLQSFIQKDTAVTRNNICGNILWFPNPLSAFIITVNDIITNNMNTGSVMFNRNTAENIEETWSGKGIIEINKDDLWPDI